MTVQSQALRLVVKQVDWEGQCCQQETFPNIGEDDLTPARGDFLELETMSPVLVIDQNKRPLDPVHPGRARCLLSARRAAVYRCYPFVISIEGSATGRTACTAARQD